MVTSIAPRLSEDRARRILKVAGRLFAEKGYAATSTTEIAKAVGIRQPTLYHYFPRKDSILEAILDEIMRVPVEMAARVAATSDPAPVKLYRLVRSYVMFVCTSPYRLGEIAWLPELRGGAFQSFWEGRAGLVKLYRRLITGAIDAGAFRRVDARLAAFDLNGSCEGVMNWRNAADSEPEALADFVASRVLAGLLADPGQLDGVRAAARAYRDPAPFDPEDDDGRPV
jgi:AcrR family transcriptional regulator